MNLIAHDGWSIHPIRLGYDASDLKDIVWIAGESVYWGQALVCEHCVWNMPFDKVTVLCPECSKKFGVSW